MTDDRCTPTRGPRRRDVTLGLAAGAAALAAPAVLRAQAAPVRIGYAIARTGP